MRNQPATVRVSSLKGSSAKKSMGGFGKLGAFDFSEIDEKEEDKKDEENLSVDVDLDQINVNWNEHKKKSKNGSIIK